MVAGRHLLLFVQALLQVLRLWHRLGQALLEHAFLLLHAFLLSLEPGKLLAELLLALHLGHVLLPGVKVEVGFLRRCGPRFRLLVERHVHRVVHLSRLAEHWVSFARISLDAADFNEHLVVFSPVSKAFFLF